MASYQSKIIRVNVMIQPPELTITLPVKVGNNEFSTTTKVWEILLASKNGELETVKKLVNECSGLIYAQYNYTPPIHLAAREGHTALVAYLLENGAHDPSYKIYPFHDSLNTITKDRGFLEIAAMLDDYAAHPERCVYKGDNGQIYYNRSEQQKEFETAVDHGEMDKVEMMLMEHPEFATDESYFWSEGILVMAAKENNRPLAELLMSYGAKVPSILKWTQFYYFERYDGAEFMMEKGMNPNTMSWHHVTILHDMAQKGDIAKAELLLKYGACINPVEKEYQSTPLGLAARWGQTEMVKYLLEKGADRNKCGAPWSTPLAWAKAKGHTEIEKLLSD